MSNIRKAKALCSKTFSEKWQKSFRMLEWNFESLKVKVQVLGWDGWWQQKHIKPLSISWNFPPRVFILFSSEIIYFAPRKPAENSIIVMN